ncbi:MAG: response regulator [Nitrospinae bacterium]|nr:response regulator [Nitrospinota bacterium]
MFRIMIVDDEVNIIKSLTRALAGEYEIESFESPSAALARANGKEFDLVMSDYRMPEMNGVDFLAAVKERQPHAARLILSGYTDRDELIGAINKAEIYRFLSKPWDEYELKVTIAQAIAHSKLLAENQRLADTVRQRERKVSELNDIMTFQKRELERLEKLHPGITKLTMDDEGNYISSIS